MMGYYLGESVRVFLVSIISLVIHTVITAQANYVGAVELSPHKAYLVYSGMSDTLTNKVMETSNIFVFKGLNDTVWVFNAGYGDPKGDVAEYRPGWDCTRSGLRDAQDVDSIITNMFGIDRAMVKFMFIAPHYHLDHINVEFLSPFFTQFGYDSTAAKIFIHIKDYFAATCTYDSSCGSIWGGPETVPWSKALFLLNMFKTIGTETDACNAMVMTFSTEVGLWEVHKDYDQSDGGHTDGTINLILPSQKIFIRGGFSRQTPTPCLDITGWQTAQVHHQVNLSFNITGINEEREFLNNSLHFELHQNFPNPFNSATIIRYYLPVESNVKLIIYDLLGNKVRTLVEQMQSARDHSVIWDGRNDFGVVLSSGVYLYSLSANRFVQTRKIILLK